MAEITIPLTIVPKLVVADDGYIVVGNQTRETVSDGDGATDLVPELQVLGTTQADGSMLLAVFNATNTIAPTLAFAKSGDAAIDGTHVTVADNEYLGRIIAFGDDGTDLESPAAEIRFVVDDTPATGEMGGSIEFFTTADGGSTLTKALTMDVAQKAIFAGAISTSDATASTSVTTGSGIFGGGVGVAGAMFVGVNVSVVRGQAADSVLITIENTDSGNSANATNLLKIPAASTGRCETHFMQGTGNGDANNMGYYFSYNGRVTGGTYPSTFHLISQDIDGSSTLGGVFSVADGTDDVVFYGNVTPSADGGGQCGTAALTWGDVNTVLLNGADINLDNDWSMLEAEDFPGYPGGWALAHRQPWRKAKVLSGVAAGTGPRLFPKGERPVFVVTDDFIEYKGRRITPEMLDRLIAVAA